jgi:integrase
VTIGLAFAARGCELWYLEWRNVQRLANINTGEVKFEITHSRAKSTGVPTVHTAFISGKLEVAVLDAYEACFQLADRNGRYFRKLNYSKSGNRIIGTTIKVGKNPLMATTKRIATYLGKEDATLYTGHSIRRTSTTICAESGMTLPQIKLVTGHKSDTIVQEYIDQSSTMKQRAADILSLDGPQTDSDGIAIRKRTRDDSPNPHTVTRSVEKRVPSGSATIVYNINFTGCTNVECKQLVLKSRFLLHF